MFRPIKTLETGQNLIIKFCSVFIKATDLCYSQLSEACTFWTLGIIFNHVMVINYITSLYFWMDFTFSIYCLLRNSRKLMLTRCIVFVTFDLQL